ncbi:type VII secretion target [Micromonospora okii]|uniref:type VII secretion target n=1 Tax=Micromonospora okii TaxID=1182970 RepID=UPI001E2ED855|nr:type VII secretion target [Micromonospora okii]
MTSPNGNLDVQPEALSAFAAASRDRADRFRQLRQAFGDGHVPRHAFGVMPASFSLAAAYAEQFEACLAGLADGAEVMADIAEGLEDTAGAYTGSDVANRDLFVPGGPPAPGPVPMPLPSPSPGPAPTAG